MTNLMFQPNRFKTLTMFLFVIFILSHLNGKCFGDFVLDKSNSENEEGYCAPYNGKVCKSYITSSQVWYSRVSDKLGADGCSNSNKFIPIEKQQNEGHFV